MQSDSRARAVLAALAPQIGLFRVAVATRLDRARGVLAAESSEKGKGSKLGEFAKGRIDHARFAMVSAGSAPLDTVGRGVVSRAIDILERVSDPGDNDFLIDIKPGTSVGAAVRARYSVLGAAFGAAGLVELVKRRTYDPALHGLPSHGHPFERWSSAERKLAPPLLIRANATDFDPFELAPFADGMVRIVVVLDGKSSGAPLARLITPGTFVAQSRDATIVTGLGDVDAPAIVALVEEGDALFIHDPRRGRAAWQRLQITSVPVGQQRRAVGRRTASQLREEIALLESFAEQPAFPVNPTDALVAAIGAAKGDPVERLADWVLDRSVVMGS